MSMKCHDCGERRSDDAASWEDVFSICPDCGKCAATVFEGERSLYVISAHGRMGNVSFNDPIVGVECSHCGFEG